jgi:cytochrome c oxidase assembly protein subunit 15
MTLEGFKTIFWFEYAHRLLGRIIGIAFLAPFVLFLIRGRIRRPLMPKLAVMFVLGAAQGVLGWYMVKSGLIDRPEVSAYRLAAHLALAVLIYLYMIWVALGLLARGRETVSYAPGVRFARAFAPIVFGLGFVTLLAGAFVAGNDAGFAYNSFPLMEGRIVPEYLFVYEPAWRNWFESVPLVQLNHRLLAALTVIAVLVLFVVSGTPSRWSGLSTEARRVLVLALIVVAGQFGLGIATLLLVVPIPLAAAHQAGALLLLTTLVWACHALRRMTSHGAVGVPGRRAG